MSVYTKALLSPLLPILWFAGSADAQSHHGLRSPDKRLETRIRVADRVEYDVLVNGQVLLQNSTASINIDHVQFGRDTKVKGVRERSVDQVLEPQVRQKSARVRDNYNELRVELEDGLAVVFRAYNEGVAYRLEALLARHPQLLDQRAEETPVAG